ncbi:MAG: S-layer homology domain-containing protein, partial [Ruminiclostridium sp.]|nr:S-layer homology domain-containing protein [Ruminiclostridium sp.]
VNNSHTEEEMKRKLLSLFLAVVMMFSMTIMSIPASAELNFNDTNGHWATDAIKYVVENGLMNGIGDNQFNPSGTTTRAMIVTILWRLEGSPDMRDALWFEDVPVGQWYSDAIAWAALNSIVDGYGNGKFGTNDPITREQFVTIMFRYAKYKGYDVSVGENTNILSYDDAFDVADWAIPAMQWACGSGMIQGIADGSKLNLEPKGNATRAQAATILYRFCEAISKDKKN